MSDIWTLTFGSKVSDELTLSNAFGAGFCQEMNLWAWQMVGAYPLTCACLLDSKAHHKGVVDADGAINVDADSIAIMPLEDEERNKLCCDPLQLMGCDVSVFQAKAPRTVAMKKQTCTAEALQKEHQDQPVAATTAGAHFKLGGGTLGSDDHFIGREHK